MGAYIVRRVAGAIPLLLLISAIVFSLIALAPGDPLLTMRMENPRAVSPEAIARLRAYYHLDDPLPVRYLYWLKSVLQGDWGYSSTYKVPVKDLVVSRMPNTLLLTVSAWLLGLLVALPIGIISAARKYSIFDYAVTFAAFLALSMPPVWFGFLTIMLFAVQLKWLPIGGVAELTHGTAGALLVDRIRHLILPMTVLGLVQVAYWVRYVRTSLLEVLGMDYIRTAKAKGLGERGVLLKHAMRNALIPVLTIAALDIPYFFGGAVVVETIFSWPGMGRLMYQAVIGSDYNLALCCLMLLAVLTIASNLVADVLYAVVDPRVSYS
ncbi:MAG: peptide/nickel transport system permease protein [Bacillota bacterium]|nr:ABC transporter permease [Bacillota bacterium]MDK2931057.1 peptide/nickel transport system permease protein [Bacillota bacterium]